MNYLKRNSLMFPAWFAVLLLLAACGPLKFPTAGGGNPAATTPAVAQPAGTMPAVQQTAAPQTAPASVGTQAAATEISAPSSTQMIPLVPSETEAPPMGTAEPMPQGALAAQQKLAASLNVPLDQVLIFGVDQVQWPDSCLGLPQPGEMCSQIVTNGWRVILDVNGQQYEARTDLTGSNVRWQPAAGGGNEAAASPAGTAQAADTPEASSGYTFSHAGVSFNYSTSLASSVSADMIPAASAGANEIPWIATPQHLQLDLQGYPVQGSLLNPQIFIYPVQPFAAANPSAGEMISTLQQFIKDPKIGEADQVPFLPIFNAAQLFHTGLQRLDFQNGTGMRFVTQYSPVQDQINNQEIFYTYQGITSDGQYVVSAILPVSLPNLPTASSTQPPGPDYGQYLQQMQQQIQSQPASSFTPSLDALDAMMRSLKVTAIQ